MARLVLVPGAWHLPTHYSAFFAALARQGYIVDSIANRTLDSTTATISDDAAVHRQLIVALIEAGHDVVVLAHSYGGMPAGIAAAGLSKASRAAAGLQGGVTGLVYICSFVIPEDVTITQAVGGKPHEWIQIMGDTTLPGNPEQHFYTNCRSEDIELATKLIRPQAAKFLSTSSEVIPAWKEEAFKDRLVYLIGLQDQALPAFAQRAMSQGWAVTEMETDHSPFLSKTEQTAAWVAQVVQQLGK